MTTAELAAVVQRTDAETRTLLTRMVERGWVQPRGEGKARSWHLSAAVYRVLDAPSGYVRVHGFEPLQQEQMILQYVQAHGQITRNEAAELCGLSPDQANACSAASSQPANSASTERTRDGCTSRQPARALTRSSCLGWLGIRSVTLSGAVWDELAGQQGGP
jgi:hypothetical protein